MKSCLFLSPHFCFGTGFVLLTIGISSIIWTPFEILMNERIKMTPGLPPLEWWKSPPDEVLVRANIFNYTNSEEFLNNSNIKLRIQEIGPIVYREKLIHSNITFNNNGTLTYVATRKAIFLPEMNTIDLNATIIVPNWPLLGAASYLYNQNFFVKMGFNVLVRTLKSQPFVKLTINDLLWNFTDPILDACQKIAPFLVPIKNLGVLAKVYTNFVNTVTVFIGPKYGHEQFFLIDKYDGSDYLPNYGGKCDDKVTNGTEGVVYPQYLTKNTTLMYWRKTFCKNALLRYQRDVEKLGVQAYKYVLLNNTFDRTQPEQGDCFKSNPALPDGLSDVSQCYFDFPLAASFPHFLYGSDDLINIVTGLSPNEDKHGSFLIVEPITGIPINSRARSQSNLIVRKLDGFTRTVQKFSNLTLPMFWLEYNQVGLPFYIAALMYFQVQLLPIVQKFFSALMIIFSIILFYNSYRLKRNERHLYENRAMHFEKEVFINKI